MSKYIVIFQQIVGGDKRPITTEYSWDRKKFDTLAAAKSHGFKTRGSDDFNIGVVEDGRLVEFTWMGEWLDYPLDEVGAALFLPAHA